ncbi:hypothetical protein PALB_16770 [Pseudoalteromonas luteoviolacea B = ATCC 29581]|nr:hypothetical protein PALB_16770 [Pseudoalteromonas luteoviolacea B = ATCC 29581]
MIHLKTRTLLIVGFITASVGVISFDGQEETVLANLECSCKVTGATNLACQQQVNNDWISWLSGKSGSAQFHYLDLLELLLGGEKSAKTNSLPSL